MSKSSLRLSCLVCLFFAMAVIGWPASIFTRLASFNGANGAYPLYGSLVQATDGSFYGTTKGGGANEAGTVFQMGTGGNLTTLYSFCSLSGCADGYYPQAELVQDANGNFYGTTYGGGANNQGTVFKITTAGKLTTLYSFCSRTGCTDGAGPYAGLVQATNGNFYGTTLAGGASDGGTVFEITAAGELTTLYSFCSQVNCTDGASPEAGVIQAGNGNFYGTASAGGASDDGTVFKITAAGKLTTLHSFGGPDGANPYAGLVQAPNGNFYGTTSAGGASFAGTVFEITPAGLLTTLHSFSFTDGQEPAAELVRATNGNFYGTTEYGGASFAGTVFEITPAGKLTTHYSFCSQPGCSDGAGPYAGLVQATNGNFYGTTTFGGDHKSHGIVFSLATGLGPFVATQPTSGKVGAVVKILGNKLTGTTSVTFNGTPAMFTVGSNSVIKTTVPNGSTTGRVVVTTPSTTLTSNVNFRVTPTITSFLPTSGAVGTSVVIRGQSFTGARNVTFGGVKATSFTVNSDTQITATVPTGAKTGNVGVITPGGTATSAATFTVT